MRVIKWITLLALFTFFVNPVFANDTSCCEQLRKEVQMLKDQQNKLFNMVKNDEMAEKKGLSTTGSLMDTLSNQFPNSKGIFQKFKNVYDSLGKSVTP